METTALQVKADVVTDYTPKFRETPKEAHKFRRGCQTECLETQLFDAGRRIEELEKSRFIEGEASLV